MTQLPFANFLQLVPPSSNTTDQHSLSSIAKINAEKFPRPTSSQASLLNQKRNSNNSPYFYPSAPPSPKACVKQRDSRPSSSFFPLALLNPAQTMLSNHRKTESDTVSQRPVSSSKLDQSLDQLIVRPSSVNNTTSRTQNLSLSEIVQDKPPPVKETKHVYIEFNPVSGRKTLNTYEFIKEIGRGQHGKVKLALNTESGELVVRLYLFLFYFMVIFNFVFITNILKAIKIVERNERPRLGKPPGKTHEEKIRREIAIMKKCRHPNVVQLKEVLDDHKSNKIYLVLEYLERGEIIWQNDEGTAVMTPEEVRDVARDVTSGLEYLHFQGIIHRDIKPANLLRDKNGNVKISDFGVSYASSLVFPNNEFELAKTAGSPAFFAPELCVSTTDEKRPPIDHKIDIWAFGVTLYCMLFGRVPFIAETELNLFEAIVNEPLTFPDFEQLSPLSSVSSLDNSTGLYNDALQILSNEDAQMQIAKDLLLHLLEKDPRKRYDISDIKKHPWILKGMDRNGVKLFLTKTKEEQKIYVTAEEVQTAILGITGRIKKGLSRLGSHALHLTGFRRKGSSSNASSRSSSIDRGSLKQTREPVPIKHEFNSAISIGDINSTSSSVSSSVSQSSLRNLNQISDTALPMDFNFTAQSASTTTTNRTNRALSQSSVLSSEYIPPSLSRQPSFSDFSSSEGMSIRSSSPRRNAKTTNNNNSNNNNSNNNARLPLSNNSLNINALLTQEDKYDIEDLPSVLSNSSSLLYEDSFQHSNRVENNLVLEPSSDSLYTTKSSSSSSSSSSEEVLRFTAERRGNQNFDSSRTMRNNRMSDGNMNRSISTFDENQSSSGNSMAKLPDITVLNSANSATEPTDRLVISKKNSQNKFENERLSRNQSNLSLSRTRSRSVTVGEVQHIIGISNNEAELATKLQKLI